MENGIRKEGRTLGKKRMHELVLMFSYITGRSLDESKKIILSTETGKAVCENNMSVLYEQQTENLYCIAMELKKDRKYVRIAQQMSEKKIARSMRVLDGLSDEFPVYGVQIDKKPELKELQKRSLISERKKMLQIQRRNQINVRRIENAVKFKG